MFAIDLLDKALILQIFQIITLIECIKIVKIIFELFIYITKSTVDIMANVSYTTFIIT